MTRKFRVFVFACLALCMGMNPIKAQDTTRLKLLSFSESLDTGWTKQPSTLPGHSVAYRRNNQWQNQCSVSLLADGSGVTLRTFDQNNNDMLHEVQIRKAGSKVTRTDSWSVKRDTSFIEIEPAEDLFLENCEWMLPSLPAEVRPLFHGIYAAPVINPHTTNQWSPRKYDTASRDPEKAMDEKMSKEFHTKIFTAMYDNGICTVAVFKDGRTLMAATDSSYHGNILYQTIIAPKRDTVLMNTELDVSRVWRLVTVRDPFGKPTESHGEGMLIQGPDIFQTYCTPVVKYLPAAVRRGIPSRYQELF